MRTARAILGVAVVSGCLCTAAPAAADDVALGTSYAAAVNVRPGTGVDMTTSTSGDASGLLDFVSPVIDEFLTPLQNGLAGMTGTAVGDLEAGPNRTLVANSPGTTQAVPTDGYPDCGSDGWTSDDCFSVNPAGSTGSLVGLNLGATQGWAAADGSTSSAQAQVTGARLTALGIDLGELGTATSSATCPQSETCAGTMSYSGVDLLDGGVQVRSSDGGAVEVSIAGGDWAPLDSLANPATVGFNGSDATVSSTGTAVEIAVPVTLDQLLTALDMTDVLESLNAYDDNSTLTLDVFIGGNDETSSSRLAGLRVGIGLDADIHVSVLGLVDENLTIPDTSTGNLAVVQLAYTAATNPDGTTSKAVTLPTLD